MPIQKREKPNIIKIIKDKLYEREKQVNETSERIMQKKLTQDKNNIKN